MATNYQGKPPSPWPTFILLLVVCSIIVPAAVLFMGKWGEVMVDVHPGNPKNQKTEKP